MEEESDLYQFGPFCLDTREHVLLRDGRLVSLAPKPLSTLLVLVRNTGHVVEKDILMAEVWPDEDVEEGNLAQHIFRLRRALGETTGKPRYIETVPGRGYRFLGAVRETNDVSTLTTLGIRSQRISDQQIDDRPPHSLAVLPFVNAGNDSALEHLSDGISESLINSLSHLPKLRVKAWNTVFRYKRRDLDPGDIGCQLRVQSVLVGRVQVSGDKLIIATELVDAANGWLISGHTYNSELSDILEIQDEIAREISVALQLGLTGEEEQRLTKHYTESPEAYRAYLKGRFFLNKRSEEGFQKSIDYFNQAMETDASYAQAYAGLADSYNLLGFYGILAPKNSFPRAKTAALKALIIDSELAEAHASLAYAKFYHDWDWRGARESFKRSIQLNPRYATAPHYYANQLTAMGKFEESIATFKQALDIDSLSLIMNAALGWAYYFARRYDEAIEQCRKAVEMDEHFEMAHLWLGWAYEQKGMFAEANGEFETAFALSGGRVGVIAEMGNAFALSGNTERAHKVLEDLHELAMRKYVSPYGVACIHAALGEVDRAFEWLEKAYADRAHLLVFLRVDPKLDALRGDPRLSDLIERTGLA
ncbi:MAG TPA: winged helix-turn-helix domain-containing protein [Pyrinomonadaceae bacterium]